MIPENKTATIYVEDLILEYLGDCRGYWSERREYEYDKMTVKEQDKIRKILQKKCDQIARKYGYSESWEN